MLNSTEITTSLCSTQGRGCLKNYCKLAYCQNNKIINELSKKNICTCSFTAMTLFTKLDNCVWQKNACMSDKEVLWELVFTKEYYNNT